LQTSETAFALSAFDFHGFEKLASQHSASALSTIDLFSAT
jgi:hypothetical protein